jgi:hypothetical protein
MDNAVQQMEVLRKAELLAEYDTLIVAHVRKAYKPWQFICVKIFRKKFEIYLTPSTL